MPPTYIRIYNDGDVDIRTKDVMNSMPIHIPPGGDTIVRWETACYIMGDPELRDRSPREPWRTQAYARLKIRYGLSDMNDEDAALVMPRLRAVDPDGTIVPMLMHDPRGDHAPWQTGDPASNRELDDLRRQLEDMRKSQDQLLALIAQRDESSPGAEARTGVAPGDEPSPDDEVVFDSPRRIRG